MSDVLETPRTVAHQAPLPMGFPRQGYWSGLPFHSPGHLPNPGIKHSSPASPASAGGFFTREPPGKPVCTFRDPKALQSLKNLRNDVTSGRGVPGPGAATVSVNIGREVGSRRPLLCGPDGFVSFSLLVAELLGTTGITAHVLHSLVSVSSLGEGLFRSFL